ncbi:MAG TPA: hypothetical protein VGX21_10225 [Methylomirabilota bacterium]|nr:hypothetical protein [Methylomirabilota bacterium]
MPTRSEAPDLPDRGRRAWFIAAVAVAAVLLGANFRLLDGSAGPKWDGDDFFAPYFTLVADHARAGRLLLWDPWTSGGAPDFADPQLGTFSPLTVFVGAIVGGSEAGFRAYWMLLWLTGPLGFVVLARHLGAPAWGAAVVALGFAFSGFYTGHAEHTSLLYPIAGLPFVLWRLDVALASGRRRPAVEAGALWGLSALGAYPLLAVLNAVFAALWAFGRWACPDSDGARPSLGTVARVMAVGGATGVLVLAPPYVGLLRETRGYSDRVGPLPREVAVESNALHPGALATAASPYLSVLQLPRPNRGLWTPTDVSTASVYLGATVTALAGLALAARPAARWRWWLVGVGLAVLVYALGRHLPLRGWLYDLLPATRYFRHPGFVRVYAMVAASILALLATRDLEAAIRDPAAPIWGRFVATAAAAAVLAGVAYAAVVARVADPGPTPRLATLHLALVWPGLVAVAAWLWLTARTPLLPVLVGGLALVDAALTLSLAAPTVYETGRPRRVWALLDAERSPRLDLTPHGLRRELRPPRWIGGQPTNKNLPLKLATLENFVALANRFHRELAGRPVLAGMATGAERLWYAREVATTAPTDAAFAAFVARSEAIGAPVLVVHPPPAMARIADVQPGAAGPDGEAAAVARLGGAERVGAEVRRYTPDRLELAVRCPGPGWLLVTDRWAPGWQATVNGAPAEVWGGDFVFRAVRVEAGSNEVRFTYRPVGWPALVIVSWGTLLAVGAIAGIAAGRPRGGVGNATA